MGCEVENMKYIRTEKGVFEVVTTERGSDNKLLYIISTSKSDTSTDWIHEGDVIGEPKDTIEELCDEFVLVEKMRKVTYHHKSSKFADFKSIAMLNE